VLTVGVHRLEVLFSPEDSANYTDAQASVSVTVRQAVPEIVWQTPDSIAYGAALSEAQLNATCSIPGSFVYTPSAGSRLAAGTHMPSVVFTPEDNLNYETAQASVSLLVTKATPAIQWQTPEPLIGGSPLSVAQLNASASVPGRFTYFPKAGSVLPPGKHAIEVTFLPVDSVNYQPAQTSVSIEIVEVKEVAIEWATPAAIPYGTPIGAGQLNAMASIPGTFVYSPCEGTVLASGEQTLRVTFIPDDDNYAPAQASVSLMVSDGRATSPSASPDAGASSSANDGKPGAHLDGSRRSSKRQKQAVTAHSNDLDESRSTREAAPPAAVDGGSIAQGSGSSPRPVLSRLASKVFRTGNHPRN